MATKIPFSIPSHHNFMLPIMQLPSPTSQLYHKDKVVMWRIFLPFLRIVTLSYPSCTSFPHIVTLSYPSCISLPPHHDFILPIMHLFPSHHDFILLIMHLFPSHRDFILPIMHLTSPTSRLYLYPSCTSFPHIVTLSYP